MAPDTKTFNLTDDQKFTGTITKEITLTWTGDLQAATLAGAIHGWLSGAGLMGFTIKLNGNQAYSDPDQVIVAGVTEFGGTHRANVASYLVKGKNTFEFTVTQLTGIVFTQDFSIADTLTVQASGPIVIIPINPPGPTDWTTVAMLLIGVIVVALAAGLFLRAKG